MHAREVSEGNWVGKVGRVGTGDEGSVFGGEGGGNWSDEFDGIRSEVDFRRAMALEEERQRGMWGQRLMRALSALRLSLLNSRTLRLLR